MANKNSIGAGIALDGEAEFRKAISSINKDLSVLGSEMKKVTADFPEGFSLKPDCEAGSL